MARANIQIEGFISNDLSIRDSGGKSVVDVTIPVTPQKKDDSGKWVDTGDTVWYRASFWEEHAQAVLMAVQKSQLVTLTGTGLKVDQYAKKDGTTGVNLTVTNPTIAAIVRKPPRGQQAQGSSCAASAPAADVWADSAPAAESVWNQDVPF